MGLPAEVGSGRLLPASIWQQRQHLSLCSFFFLFPSFSLIGMSVSLTLFVSFMYMTNPKHFRLIFLTLLLRKTHEFTRAIDYPPLKNPSLAFIFLNSLLPFLSSLGPACWLWDYLRDLVRETTSCFYSLCLCKNFFFCLLLSFYPCIFFNFSFFSLSLSIYL